MGSAALAWGFLLTVAGPFRLFWQNIDKISAMLEPLLVLYLKVALKQIAVTVDSVFPALDAT